MTLIARNEFTVRTLQASNAPPQPPTPIPILIGVGVSDTDANVTWSAVSGATGYLLEYSGSDLKSGSYTLGVGATSQDITGLTPGANYRAVLTAYLSGGVERTGEIFFSMPDPPTNTPIPPTPVPLPTNTPLRLPTQQPSQDNQQQPPTNTPIPPPPATNTPARQPTQQPSQDNQQQPSGPYASLINALLGYQAETQHGKPHVERWTRALAALGWGGHANPMTLAEAQAMARQFSSARWDPVVAAPRELQPPPPSSTPVPPTPIPATPVPPTAIPPTPIPPSPVPQQPSYTVPQSLIDTLLGYQAETQHGAPHVERWTRALAGLGWGSHANPMTLSEAKQMARQFSPNRWNPVVEALEKLAGN